MFDLDNLNSAKIHTEQIEMFARRAWVISRCMPKQLSGSRRLMDLLGSSLIATGTRLKARAHAQPETAPSPMFLITL
jgi:hypothetical protein